MFESSLHMHLIEPTTKKTIKAKVKPQAFLNVKAKIGENTMETSKLRALSTVI